MQAITGSVGEAGTNSVSDVALVQAILMKTQSRAATNRPAAPYLTSYDGVYGNGTKAAITAFQNDWVFVSADGTQSVAVANTTAGLIKPGDASWTRLLQKVATDFTDMGVLAGGKTVYVRASAAALQVKIGAVAGAGPGESHHNFGMAVDLGFEGLRWLQKNGTVEERETSWLHRLDPTQKLVPEALKFWELLRTVGTSAAVGAFRGPESDRPHLQNWNDAGVVMATRPAVPAPPSPPVTQADVVAMHRALRAQMDLADANWQNWTPR